MVTRIRLMVLAVVSGTSVAMAGGAVAAPQANGGPDSTVQVIADGLDNPRGVTMVGGKVLIAETGSGGDGPCLVNEPDPGQPGHPEVFCYGPSGAVTKVNPASGVVRQVVTGLPSLALEDGSTATGIVDLSFGPGGLLGVFGGTGVLDDRETIGLDAPLLTNVVRLTRRGPWPLADLGAFEEMNDPHGASGPYSNPYSVVATRGGAIALDAGGNSMLRVDRNGDVSVLAVFPDELVPAPEQLGLPPGTQIPMEAVPTIVTRGPDGAYYVGLHRGFPFVPGRASVMRVVPGEAPTVHATGFTGIIGIDFDRQGRLWVLEHQTNGLLSGDSTGALIRVNHDGTHSEIAPGSLTFPGGLAIGRDGSIYVTNNAVFSDTGQLLRIRP